MAMINCKMCGGNLVPMEKGNLGQCDSCGRIQTIPSADSEKKMNLFARAGRLRAACEFDKASGIYESIVAEFPTEAEAYWGLLLCKYGIEYVDDPATGNKVPTCHRSSFDSVLEDADFDQVMETADVLARKVYREEAKQIEQIRLGIVEVSGKEAPYDIFICYKETDVNGDRTLDSVLAQDLYDALVGKGYRVFFARITLEDKLGQEYEPFIFAALNSAKIMLAVGTDYDYYNAVWVKNEWSRFLKLMATDKSKYLIPCFKGLDAYDIPKEFARFQAQDLGKVGATQDLLRGIAKLLPNHPASMPPQVAQAPRPNAPVSSGNEIVDLVAQGLKLKALNRIREQYGWGARKAKDLVDRIAADLEAGKPVDLARLVATATPQAEPVRPAYQPTYQKPSQPAAPPQADVHHRAQVLQIMLEESLDLIDAAFQAAMNGTAPVQTDPAERFLRRDRTILQQRSDSRGQGMLALLCDGSTFIHNIGGENLQCDVSQLNGIRQLELRPGYNGAAVIALRNNGTVTALSDPEAHFTVATYDFARWTDVVSFCESGGGFYGLKGDGTILHPFRSPECKSWNNIISISGGRCYSFAGLKRDGTVIQKVHFDWKPIDLSAWRDVVAVLNRDGYILGVLKDGRVMRSMTKGFDPDTKAPIRLPGYSNCYVIPNFRLFTDMDAVIRGYDEAVARARKNLNPDQYRQLLKQVAQKNALDEKRKQLINERVKLEKELKNTTGLFAGGKRKKLEEQIVQINAQIAQLK